jgi:hypothetical protein
MTMARKPKAAPEGWNMARKTKVGAAPEGWLQIYDHEGNVRGHVTPGATQSTVARFIGRQGSTLGKGPDGKPCWHGPKPPRKAK